MSKDLAQNRKARFDYEIIETFEAGIALLGTEIKSLRDNGGVIAESYIDIEKGEAWLKNATIPAYKFGNIHNHEEKRPRKLLLHKNEIQKLKKVREQKGLTIIPLSMYLTKKGIVKVKIATARGKRDIDKRETIKNRDEKRDIDRAMKGDSR